MIDGILRQAQDDNMLMVQKNIKTRFAPSPTGFMHVGNFRTALYSYLYAKKHNASFIIRIEDTDQSRKVEGAEQAIFRVLKKMGLDYDEGPDIGGPNGPYRQSERLDIYKKYISELLKKEKAYHCFCSQKRLAKLREDQQSRGEAPMYDRHCINLSKDEVKAKIKAGKEYVIRQKIDAAGVTKFTDLVHGQIEIENKTLDDHILIKSDGWPTYNFANVIDDHLMEITHIIRGDEFITSTPKYIQLYNVFKWQVPQHAHLPLILDENKAKLSKRQGHSSVEELLDDGYLKETIINFVSLLGWNPGDDRELFTIKELAKEFDLDKVNKSGAIFNIDKLNWMNGHYIRQKNLDELTDICIPYLEKTLKIKITNFNNEYIKSIVGLEQERIKKLSEIGEMTAYFFQKPKYDVNLLIWKNSDEKTTKSRLEFLHKYLSSVPKENWTRSTLEEKLIQEIKRLNFSNGDTLWPMRTALSGQEKSPSPFEIAEVLGQKETLERIQKAIDKIK